MRAYISLQFFCPQGKIKSMNYACMVAIIISIYLDAKIQLKPLLTLSRIS